MREIERTIKNYEREKSAERTNHYERADLHEERDYFIPNLIYPETKATYGKYGMMREDYLKEHNPGLWNRLILHGELTAHLNEIDKTAKRADRTDDAGADENSGSDRGTESDRPTEMGGLDGELQGAGGGNRAYGVGVQLTLFPTEDETNQNNRRSGERNAFRFFYI